MMLGQDVFHAIKLLENIKGGNQKTHVAVRMPIGWVLSGSIPSPNGVRATTFKFKLEDVALADQVNKWYELEPYGTFKQADPRSAADKRDLKNLTLPRFMMAAVMLSECSWLLTISILTITFTLQWSSLSLSKGV